MQDSSAWHKGQTCLVGPQQPGTVSSSQADCPVDCTLQKEEHCPTSCGVLPLSAATVSVKPS